MQTPGGHTMRHAVAATRAHPAPRGRRNAGTCLAPCGVLVVLLGCSTATRSTSESPEATAPAVEVGARRVADVDAAMHAHVLAPSESLAVRLLGTVGPDGNWSLGRIAVEPTATGVRIVPIVQQGNARQVIQMLIPLDAVLWVPLPPGTHTVEVQGRDSTFVDRVHVAAGMSRRPPDTRLAYKIVTSGVRSQDFVSIEALAGDGFIEAIEIRETRSAGVGAWRRLDGCQRVGSGLEGRVAVPENDDLRTLEARAVDGQGGRDPEPGFLNLNAR